MLSHVLCIAAFFGSGGQIGHGSIVQVEEFIEILDVFRDGNFLHDLVVVDASTAIFLANFQPQ